MSQLDLLAFEMPRRPVRFFSQTILPNGLPMNYTKNPNDAVNGLTDGDTLVYTSPMGTLFQMDDGTYYYKKSTPNTWEQVGGGSGTGTLSGATNGLGLSDSGTTVTLGGDLSSGTTINGLGLHDFTFDNINDFQITPSGSSAIAFGIDESGLLFTFTGGSVSYDSNAGLVYGGDYSTTFINESLVSKRYVDTIAAGLHPKTAVLVATTGETLSLSGLTTIDGVTLTAGDRVLVKDQTNSVENGIYVAAVGTWSRSTDFDGAPTGEVEQGALIPIISGDTNQNTQWILITKDPDVGATELVFTLFSTGQYTGGIGIDITGNVIAVDGTSLAGSGITWSANTFNADIPVIDYPITGGTNGLSKEGYDIKLGGNISCNFSTSPTTITMNSNSNRGIKMGTQSATGEIIQLGDISWAGSSGSFYIRTDYVGGQINGITQDSHLFLNLDEFETTTRISELGDKSGVLSFYDSGGQVTLRPRDTGVLRLGHVPYNMGFGTFHDICGWCGNGTETVSICLYGCNTCSGAGIITDSRTIPIGIEYSDDYHSGYTLRSLVDKEYVDDLVGEYSGITTTALTGATNGLCKYDSNNVALGGALTGDTEVDIDLGDMTFAGSANQSYQFGYLGMNLAFNGSCVYLTNSGNDFKIVHRSGTCVDINRSGMTYGGTSYNENNFCVNTVVTKNYVDNCVGGIEGNAVTGATNGLCKVGQDICLGGSLSNETTIDTTGYNFNICNSGAGLTNIEHINGSDCALIRAFASGVGGTVLLCATDLMTFCFGGSAIFNSPSNGWACYSSAAQPASFTANAIPNVGYVSGYTQSAVTQNSNVLSIHEVSTTSYTATTSSDFIGASGGTTIYLPDAPKQGQRIVVADIGGDALSGSIVICSNTLQIIGGQTATINTDYGSITFIYNGSFWSAAAFIN